MAKKKKKYKSDTDQVIHETAAGLHRIGLMPEKTMREFDGLCLTPAKELSTKKDEMRSDYSDVDIGKPVVGKHYKASMKGIKIALSLILSGPAKDRNKIT